MSELFWPMEVAVVVMAVAAGILGAAFGTTRRLLLAWSPASRTACLRVFLGSIWAADATLKFLPNAPTQLAYLLVLGARQYQSPWLYGWYTYWAAVVGSNPGLWWYGTGALEAILAGALLLGVARRMAYIGGFLLSVALWAIPEGLGVPYDAASTDLGAGILYAVAFLVLLQLDSVSGPERVSVDSRLETRWPRWSLLGGPSHRPDSPSIRPGSPMRESEVADSSPRALSKQRPAVGIPRDSGRLFRQHRLDRESLVGHDPRGAGPTRATAMRTMRAGTGCGTPSELPAGPETVPTEQERERRNG